ncbi:EscU/YscU/HrcU family type III secretion system export apparatus switch protein [Caulobacter sp. CCNWLY153]|uniref:EscU/YscU/HrcU family type III secretion system export apparatus switch protein n=1 Tax=unclassified Caulobacter TaxID=2648921 RepID=UPI002FF3370E
MENTEQNRSEKPTPFKLKKAREKGSVARSMDLSFLTGSFALLAYLWISGDAVWSQLTRAAAQALVAAPNVSASRHEILIVTAGALTSMFRPLTLLCATIFLVVGVFEVVQTGLVFSTQPLKPDFSRLSPAKGFKRVFSVRTLIETAKTILKFGAYATLATVIVQAAWAVDGPAATDAARLAQAMGGTSFRLLMFFVGGALVFALLDQWLVRREFLKQMRMSRRELRRESRDREGEPRIKQRRRQLHGEFVKMSQSLRNMRGADVLLTNPTHFAVALRYDPRSMEAPIVVSLGAHQFAQRLKAVAFSYGVPIVPDPPLARALYRSCQLRQAVPPDYYGPVSRIYMTLRERRREHPAREP